MGKNKPDNRQTQEILARQHIFNNYILRELILVRRNVEARVTIEPLYS
jgi:hypothetical protein